MAIENRGLVLVLYTENNGENSYGYPYWVWPYSNISGSAHDAIDFAALCWDSNNGLRLFAAAAASTRLGNNISLPDDATEIAPVECSSVPSNYSTRSGHGATLNISDPNEPANVTYATFLRLEADGDLHAYTMDRDSVRPFYSVFDGMPCDLPLYCGFYGICDRQKKDNRCTCHKGFIFMDESNTQSGCILKDGQLPSPFQGSSMCATSTGDQEVDFVQIDNVHYFSLNFTDPQYTLPTLYHCKDKCWKDCLCTGAFWNDQHKFCFLIHGQVGTIQQQGDMVAFIKFRYVNVSQTDRFKFTSKWISVTVSVLTSIIFTLVIACICLYMTRRRPQNLQNELENKRLLLSLSDNNPQQFTWKQLQEYTCGFSDFLGGGGFGNVFRGSLPDGTAIAVKKLDADGSHGQGNKEFMAEVSILSRIEHAHLVQLIGFCLEGKHRLLVYEYMENGSLDAWLFRGPSTVEESSTKDRMAVLPWKTRFHIALGTSKGLAYLHEECKEKVIHMDLKPQNILLGRNFMPKISDFGMSRRIAREQSTVITVMRGTPGYLAPEWLLDFAVTEKCDVYSFGIVPLEMVSGRKVRDLRELKQKLAMRPLRESLMLDLLDEDLRFNIGSDVKEEDAVVRMVEVALMCVRTDPVKRPAMSSVTLMLEGTVEVQQSAMDDDGDGDEQQ